MQKMRSDAIRNIISLFVLSSFGFTARWAQSSIFDENGLATAGATASHVLISYSIMVIIGFAILLRPLRNFEVRPGVSYALRCDDVIYKALSRAGAICLIAAGVMLMLKSNNYESLQQLIFILGALACVAGASVAYISASDDDTAGVWVATLMPIIFLCLWLITAYKQHGTNPVVWQYAVEIIAIACATEAVFLVSGFAFDKPKIFPCLMFCLISAFFMFMTLGDIKEIEFSLCLIGIALYCASAMFAIMQNIKRK